MEQQQNSDVLASGQDPKQVFLKSRKQFAYVLIAVVIIAVIGLIFLIKGRQKVINKSEITQLIPVYTKMQKPLVHGELELRISGGIPQKIVLCPTEVGGVVKKSGSYFISCTNSAVKQLSVGGDEMLTERLVKGEWYLQITAANKTVTPTVPARVIIKSGQSAHIDFTLN